MKHRKPIQLIVNEMNKINVPQGGYPLRIYIATDKRKGPIRFKISPIEDEQRGKTDKLIIYMSDTVKNPSEADASWTFQKPAERFTVQPPFGQKNFAPFVYLTFVSFLEKEVFRLHVEVSFPVDLKAQL